MRFGLVGLSVHGIKIVKIVVVLFVVEAKMVVFHSTPFDMLVLRKEGIEI